MKLKKLCVTVLCTFLLTLAFSGVGKSAPEELPNVYYLEYGGLKIDVRAPVQAYGGENITITVKTEAVVPQLFINYVNIDLYGRVDVATEVYLGQITHLANSSLSSYEAQYDIAIPDNLSPGLTYGKICCEWEFMGATQKIHPSGFALTYVKDVAFEELQADYDELNATYQSTLVDYNQLESKYKGEADSARNLMYVFIVTTVIAAITVGVLLIKKPKKVWV